MDRGIDDMITNFVEVQRGVSDGFGARAGC